MLSPLQVQIPQTVSDAVDLLTQDGTRALAGGTDLVVQMRDGEVRASTLVDLHSLGLRYIDLETGLIKIGSLTTVSDLLSSGLIQSEFDCIYEAAQDFGAAQSRNMATIGGNLCSAVPSADLAPPLLVLDAQITTEGPDGKAAMQVEEFFTGPKKTVLKKGEILCEIGIAVPPPQTGTSFLKLGRRQAMTLAVVNIASRLTLNEDDGTIASARIALGAVAPTPVRTRLAEGMLTGHIPSEALFESVADQAAAETSPISDLRATAEYRLAATKVLVKRSLGAAWKRAQASAHNPEPHPTTGTHRPDQTLPPLSSNGARVELTINDQQLQVHIQPQALLLDVLRDQLELRGTKPGCGTGECGACTVLMDGQPISSCLLPAYRATGHRITTVEGMGTLADLHPLQEAFISHGAVQCGYCAPGMLMAGLALFEENSSPSEPEIKYAIAGNLCRCTGYVKIIDAMLAAAHAEGTE